MPEISYKEANRHFNKANAEMPPVFLIWGEEYLAKSVLKLLLDNLIPETDKGLHYEALDGDNENISTAVEKVNTFSLLSEKKVVALIDCQAFYSKQDSDALYEKARSASKDNRYQKAATLFLNYMGLLNLDFDDLSEENRSRVLNRELDEDEKTWLDKMIRYCLSEGLNIVSPTSPAERLNQAVLRGFPPGNHLIIVTELADKRRLLYKSIKEKGLVIDCSVPKGSRKADMDQQSAVLNDTLKTILKKRKKTIDARCI